MIIEKIGEGENTEEARENARKLLNAPENAEIKFEIINLPQKKVLGLFGGKKARVKAFYEAKDAKPSKKAPRAKTMPKEEKKPAAKAAAKPEKKAEAKKPETQREPKPVRKERTREPLSAQRLEKAQKDCTEYAKTVLEKMLEREVSVESKIINDDTIYISLDSNDHDVDGIIIGRRGETLDSVQYLTSLVANKGHDDYVRVTLDVANYREKRESTLISLAHRNAKNVLRSGRRITLEPMNPYERHIIHTAVQDIDGVSSHSIGSNIDRRVVITPNEGFRPHGGDNSHYDRPRSGGRNFHSNNRQSAPAATAEDRAPKRDNSAAPLYGIVTKNEKEE